jgi:hypothetical protein
MTRVPYYYYYLSLVGFMLKVGLEAENLHDEWCLPPSSVGL